MITTNVSEETCNIIFSLNIALYVPLNAAINSIVRNCKSPDTVFFHIVIPPEEEAVFIKKVIFRHPSLSIQLFPFQAPVRLREYIYSRYGKNNETGKYMNYARFYLKELFPQLSKVIFLDPDLIVLDDIEKLYALTQFDSSRYLAVVPHIYLRFLYTNHPYKIRNEIKKIKQPFNGGVFVTDLRYWDNSILEKIYTYFDLNKAYDYKLFSLSTEPLQNLIFHNYIPLPRAWNRCGFGNLPIISFFLRKPIKEISILHWSGGHMKPWINKKTPYYSTWEQYR